MATQTPRPGPATVLRNSVCLRSASAVIVATELDRGTDTMTSATALAAGQTSFRRVTSCPVLRSCFP